METVETFQSLDAMQAFLLERASSVENMQDQAFPEVGEGQIAIVGEVLEDFQDPLFPADAGCTRSTMRFLVGTIVLMYHTTLVPH